ncbi:UNVERIFIED_CONTAM: hypothetical protein Sradi_3089000 [Sesamum radiatum]|uniref:Transmembrane protein n=1 Tax=Sesamum radiatum TaxID=300843 RepID=A0AAW2RC31_SESRA
MGGGDGDDPQKLKRMAAAAYDYDNDPRWADYWSNVLIPPHMASRSDVVNHFKHKFYQRYIDRDLIVEPIGINSTSQPTRTSTPPTQSASTSNSNTRPRSSGSSSRAPGASTSPPPTSLRWDRQTIQFSVNAWKPRAWNLQALQVWFQSVLVTKDFIYSMYCLCFVTSHLCLKFALIPIMCRALERVAKFLRRNFSRSTLYSCITLKRTSKEILGWEPPWVWKVSHHGVESDRKYLEETCVWVESNTTTLSILSSQAEIGIGFLLIISLFSPQRNIIQAFMYWQLLKLMYHAPATAGYHQSAWARIGRTVNPLIQRYAPFLNTPISSIQRWWFR